MLLRHDVKEMYKDYLEKAKTNYSTLLKHYRQLEDDDFANGNIKFDGLSKQLQNLLEKIVKVIDSKETGGKFGQELAIKYTQIDWSALHRMRQKLSHWYDDIEPILIKEVIERYLPPLLIVIDEILALELNGN